MAAAPPSNPQFQIDNSIEQQQLNNFLGPVNGALGGLPVAERNQSYFAVFIGAGGTGPEIIDQTACFITYLVDENGNISKPSEDYNSLYNLIQNFPTDQNAILRNDAGTAFNNSLAGRHPVTAIGRQQPILYNQTGSSVSASVNSILFNSDVDPGTAEEGILDFRGTMVGSAYGDAPTTYTTITNYTQINSAPDSGVASFDTTTGRYTVVSSGIGDIQTITFRIIASFTNNFSYLGYPLNMDAYIRLLRNGIQIGDYTVTVPQSGGNATAIFLVNQDASDLVGNPYFEVQVKTDALSNLTLDSLQFRCHSQNPSPGEGAIPYSQIPFWENDNGGNSWITASAYLSQNYGSVPLAIQECLDFNFSPILQPFNVQPGDRIRFGYNPNNDYTIYEVSEPQSNSEGLLKLKLNTAVPSEVYKQNFVLHRVNSNDPAYIILAVNKNSLVGNIQNFNGIILPEYPTKRLKDNLDNIILDLKSRGIITDNEN